jgi:hypothetical protein
MVNRRIAGVGGSEFSAMGWGRILPVVVVLSAGGAAAQTPWPAQQQPQPQQQAPWPAQQQSQPQGPSAWPAQQSKPQGQAAWPSQQPQQSQGQSWPQQHQAAAPGATMMPGAGMMSPMGPPGGQQVPPCAAVLNKLHAEAEKRGAEAKAAQARHATREELCKFVTNLVAAEGKFTKAAEQEATNCRIPPEAIKQMKAGHENLVSVREKLCSAAAGGGPPSLAEALGTDKMPLDENEKTNVKRGGVLDSLTGAPIR